MTLGPRSLRRWPRAGLFAALLGIACEPQAPCDADGDGICPPLDCDDQNADVGEGCPGLTPSLTPTGSATPTEGGPLSAPPVSVGDVPDRIKAMQPREGLGSALAAAPSGSPGAPDALLIGAFMHQATSGGPNTGGAYLIPGPVTGALPLAEVADGTRPGTLFHSGRPEGSAGFAVATGDVTCDGVLDYIIGEPGPLTIEANTFLGAVYIIPGPVEDGLYPLSAAPITLDALDLGSRFGFSLAVVGDVSGDGCPDLLVGAPYAAGASAGGGDRGEAFLFHGPIIASRSTRDADVRFVGEGSDGRAGWSVDGGEDLDGDGRPDLLIGALSYRDGVRVATGAAYAIFKPEGPVFNLGTASEGGRGVKLLGQAAGDQAGRSATLAGDFNGDGYPDLVVGAARNDAQAEESGAAYVVLLQTGASHLTGTQDLGDLVAGARAVKLSGQRAGDHAGWTVRGVGDVDGDGLADVVVAAPHESTEGDERGRIYLMPGQREGSTFYRYLEEASAIFEGERDFDSLGYTLAGPVDLNGDGLGDLVFSELTERETPAAQQEFLRWTGEIIVVYGAREGNQRASPSRGRALTPR